MKHTAGPWPTDTDLYLDAAYAAAKGSNQYQWPPRNIEDAEVTANANLMKASPDLYEACIYMHKLLVDMGHGGLAGAILGENAIAKAEARN